MSISLLPYSFSLHRPNYLQITKPRSCNTTSSKNERLIHTSCVHNQNEREDSGIIDKRSILIGLGSSVLSHTSLSFTSQALGLTGSPVQVSDDGGSGLQPVTEFGPNPRPLNTIIRALVERPKITHNMSEKKVPVEILVVDEIDVPNDDPVRFDVYVSKPQGGFVGPELGEISGSFVDLARIRVGRNQRVKLEVGITRRIMKEISAEECEKLVVSLVPRSGDVIIGGIHIRVEYVTDFIPNLI